MQALSSDEVKLSLVHLPGWTGDADCLTRTWQFPGFRPAMDFMAACVPGIEARNHHPEWTNIYDRVSVRLRTHDAGDRVTEADLDLARHLDAWAAKLSGI